MENMRYFLNSYSPEHPIHFGFKYKPIVSQGWFCGGAGVVLSKKAVQKFVEVGIKNKKLCQHTDNEYDDVILGKPSPANVCLIANPII
jgi:glycoprotein-N-acetylgalactosamine 3-beta-galactosyltransferase